MIGSSAGYPARIISPLSQKGIDESKEQDGPGPDTLKRSIALFADSQGSLMFLKQGALGSSGPTPALRLNRALGRQALRLVMLLLTIGVNALPAVYFTKGMQKFVYIHPFKFIQGYLPLTECLEMAIKKVHITRIVSLEQLNPL
ncbi:hypothetical protein ACJ77P_06940 [Syntrophus buswellii]|uniref:hypothetical protein n=1 Tax=Syntrophus TaxID=43773 RepID=UPI00345E2516